MEGERPRCEQKRLVSLSARLCHGEQEGERVELDGCDGFFQLRACLGLRARSAGLCLPALCVLGKPRLARHGRSCAQAAFLAASSPSCFGGELGGSQPATHFICLSQGVLLGFAKPGAALSPLLHGVLERSFSSLVIRGSGCCAGCSEMPEQRLCKVRTVFIRPV